MSTKKNFNVIFVGDLVGVPGQLLFSKWADVLRKKYKANMVIVNAENAALNGRGLTPSIYKDLKAAGADVVTTGNHVWGQRTVYDVFKTHADILRPINFPSQCPGNGYFLTQIDGVSVAVINAQGRVYMHENLSCPFTAIDTALTYLKPRAQVIIVDFHAEATSEKQGIGFNFDGKISAMYGTHTHVQTADERILTKGTAYISDAGCCGAVNSMLGMKKEPIIERFYTQMPVKFEVETTGPFALHGVFTSFDVETGKAISIERIKIIDDDLVIV